MMIERKKLQSKYMWVSKEFNEWIVNQQKEIKKAGFQISQDGMTRKLLNEVLLPNEIKLSNLFPTIKLKRKIR